MSDVPGDDIPDYNISDDSPISPIEAVPLSSVSSDSPSSAILSTGITIFLSIYCHFYVVCGRAPPVLFGNDLTLVCATSDLYTFKSLDLY